MGAPVQGHPLMLSCDISMWKSDDTFRWDSLCRSLHMLGCIHSCSVILGGRISAACSIMLVGYFGCHWCPVKWIHHSIIFVFLLLWWNRQMELMMQVWTETFLFLCKLNRTLYLVCFTRGQNNVRHIVNNVIWFYYQIILYTSFTS